MEFIATLRIVGAATLLLVSNYCAAQEASDERIPLMFTNGLVKSEGTKLDSCTVIVYQNNDSVHSQVTGSRVWYYIPTGRVRSQEDHDRYACQDHSGEFCKPELGNGH